MKKALFAPVLLCGLVGAAGCSGSAAGDSPSAPVAVSLSRVDIGSGFHLAGSRTGASMLARGADVVRVTRAFVGARPEMFGVVDADAELRVDRVETDELAMTHARFEQVVRGVPVRGAELLAHYDAAGRLASLDTTLVSGVDALDVTPAITASEAVTIAHADAAASAGVDPAEPRLETGAAKLLIADSTLAYEVRTRAIFGEHPAIWVTTIDAKTKTILSRYDDLETIEGTASGVLGDTKTIQISAANDGYTLLDNSRGATISTSTAAGEQITAEEGAPLVSSSSPTAWDAVDPGSGAAVDAHFYAGLVYDYYKLVHGRDAIDGASGTMLSVAHYGKQYDNAFWDGASMTYGDGQRYRPLSVALDVCGHEFTHGVTQATSKLTYVGQTGALNEGVSDIFGAFVEHAMKPNPVANWKMGETATTDGSGIRDFVTPAAGQQPDHMSGYVVTQQDNGGVHINSGIVNNAAYLMTMGGVNPTSGKGPLYGIGWSKSERLWYRVNTKYLSSTSNFASAAVATMEAAKDLGLTDNEQNIIDCAWKSTGVVAGACAEVVNPDFGLRPEPSGKQPAPGERRDGAQADDLTFAPAHDEAPAPTTETFVSGSASGGCNAGGRGDFGTFTGFAFALFGVTIGRGRRRRC